MEKDDKRIEEIVNKLMTADTLEKAPVDFTNNVMAKVAALPKSSVTTYKPLIPKAILYGIAVSFVALVAYILFKNPSDKPSLSERYNLPEVSLNPLEGLSFDFSNTLMYATVLFAIMLSIQVPILKQYFNNRMAI